MLPKEKMPEAEVTLRLAIALIERSAVISDVVVAIDGAQVKTGSRIHFPIVEFLELMGWSSPIAQDKWQCTYKHIDHGYSIIVHSSSGEGDLVAILSSGQVLRVESKKGPLLRSKSSQEYPLIREAIGQLMTVEHAKASDILAVAVPESEKFTFLAQQWRKRPLMRSAGIKIITVNRNNDLSGLEDVGL
nr:hypothetical protein [uncultured Desulfobacter sp.]